MSYSIENIEINNKKKSEWNNLSLAENEILYYNNNDNIRVSSGISGFIFVFVLKFSAVCSRMRVVL
jgi:hypothetical protein